MSIDPKEMDIVKILEILPHRYPFVMVDRILDVVPGESIRGIKNVTINEPFFQGHFPSRPVMPGVMILEGMAQIAAVMAYLTMEDKIGKTLVYFAGMDGVRFRKLVTPGDQIVFEVKLVKRKLRIWTIEGKALVDGQTVAEANLMATFSD